MSTITIFRKLLNRVHSDERGSISLETILIVGAIALPILIYVLKFGWPKVRDYFYDGLNDLEKEGKKAVSGQ